MKNYLIASLFILGMSCNHKNENKSTNNSMQKVALEFINDYVKNCDNMKEGLDVEEWVATHKSSSDLLKSELSRILKEADEKDPEYGLGFDPIFNAQDYPDKGFKLISFDSIKRIVVVGDKELDGFKLNIHMIKVNNVWKVNGIGIINTNSTTK